MPQSSEKVPDTSQRPAGEYRLAIQVPSCLTNGTYPIVATGTPNAVSSPNTVSLAVHN